MVVGDREWLWLIVAFIVRHFFDMMGDTKSDTRFSITTFFSVYGLVLATRFNAT